VATTTASPGPAGAGMGRRVARMSAG
jgi:hypothetical protein